MAASGPVRGTTAFAALSAVLVTTYFAFVVFAGWIILQYGVKTTDFGWQVKRLGDSFYVSSVSDHGPAEGMLRPGDRILQLNGEPVSTEAGLGLAMRSVAGSSLYIVRVMRGGAEKEVWLRARTEAGFSFFQERLPLLGSSLLMFFSGLAMLLKWDSLAARFGFVAALCSALRMGAWAILPLSTFYRPQEFHPYFLFWLPVSLGLPLAYQAMLHFSPGIEPPKPFRALGWMLYTAWAALMLTIGVGGAVPAPVPEGMAFVYWDRVEYRPSPDILQLGMAGLLGVTVFLCALWLMKMLREETDADQRRRLSWVVISGLFFVLPGALVEIVQWTSGGIQAVSWSWLPALMAMSFSYSLIAERVMRPALVLRDVAGAILPGRLFAALDSKYFPAEAQVEADLRSLSVEIDNCTHLEQLTHVLTHGLEKALAAAGVAINPEVPVEEMLDLGPKHTGQPYTRREEKLIQQALTKFRIAQNRVHKRAVKKEAEEKEASSLNLLRECPQCGSCYDSDVVHCPEDGSVPILTLPIERTIEGKYRLDRLIGRGGMGAVYAGRDTRLNRRIAVKIMLSELFGHLAALRRFEREAQAAARLNHPNVVHVYDYGPIGGMGAFLVMEFVEGRSWRAELNESGAVAAAVCLPWISQLLDGMEAAHDAGIVHRDLKPENLLLSEKDDGSPQLKILDFGLAKMQLIDFSREERLSLGISMIGTIGYVPPEQLSGGKVDQRSDIYAIGRIVLETLTGKLPEGSGEKVEGVEEPIAGILRKCMAREREARYDRIPELRRELVPALESLAAACQM